MPGGCSRSAWDARTPSLRQRPGQSGSQRPHLVQPPGSGQAQFDRILQTFLVDPRPAVDRARHRHRLVGAGQSPPGHTELPEARRMDGVDSGCIGHRAGYRWHSFASDSGTPVISTMRLEDWKPSRRGLADTTAPNRFCSRFGGNCSRGVVPVSVRQSNPVGPRRSRARVRAGRHSRPAGSSACRPEPGSTEHRR